MLVRFQPGVPPKIVTSRFGRRGQFGQRRVGFPQVRKGHLVLDDHFGNDVVEELSALEVVLLPHVDVIGALSHVEDPGRLVKIEVVGAAEGPEFLTGTGQSLLPDLDLLGVLVRRDEAVELVVVRLIDPIL